MNLPMSNINPSHISAHHVHTHQPAQAHSLSWWPLVPRNKLHLLHAISPDASLSQPIALGTAKGDTQTGPVDFTQQNSLHVNFQDQGQKHAPPNDLSETPRKRQRMTYDTPQDKSLSRPEATHPDSDATRSVRPRIGDSSAGDGHARLRWAETWKPRGTPITLEARVSPPPKKPPPNSDSTRLSASSGFKENAQADGNSTASTDPRVSLAPDLPTAAAATTKHETLNPRLVVNDPVGHAKRGSLLKYLHSAMAGLNSRAKSFRGKKGTQSDIEIIVLTDQDIITMALDEEEALARDKGGVYGNVVKNRIGAYTKMKIPEWMAHIPTTTVFQNTRAIGQSPAAVRDLPKVIETSLTPAGELVVAYELVVANQAALTKHGYIDKPPTPEEAAEAAAAVAAAWNYEVCDRCGARFQVFPNRNDEGELTSGGSCTYHPNRKMYPPREKGNSHLAGSGTTEAYYPCCNAAVGSTGCTECEHHVFKAGTPARLAAVLPFITTPANPAPAKDREGHDVGAVTFDCEMGYTTIGMEVIRMTAVSWPQNVELVDTLVRPLGIILDFNSRFSGVFPEHFTSALSYADYQERQKSGQPMTEGVLPMVESPSSARDLLCSFLQPSTPLIGHGLENDLNVVRLCHPTIIDTMLLFPHRRGLPFRLSLKMLAQQHLGRKIQTGGERGHDSLEDAVATGDLVRVKVKSKWEKMMGGGKWGARDGVPVNLVE